MSCSIVDEYLDYCSSPWGRYRFQCIVSNLFAFIGAQGGRYSVLDVGCGIGTMAQVLSSHVNKIVAIDSSRQMIEYAAGHREKNVSYRCVDFDMFSSTAKFDVILLHNVFEYQKNKLNFLRKVQSFLYSSDSICSMVVINRHREIVTLMTHGDAASARLLQDFGIYNSKNFKSFFYLPTFHEIKRIIERVDMNIKGLYLIGSGDYFKYDEDTLYCGGDANSEKDLNNAILYQFIVSKS